MVSLCPRVLIKWCGRNMSFADGLRIQKNYLANHLDDAKGTTSIPKNVLLLLEHSPVYTVGIRTRGYSDEEEMRLRKLGADFFRSDRGGLITFHGPGQLVAYPILNLEDFKKTGGVGGGPKGVRWYVCQLEKCLVRVCAKFGLVAEAPGPPLTGVWTEGRKVAAIGIHATKRCFVSHGVALNCDVDLRWFDHIVPCGLEGKEVTSLARELSRGQESLKTAATVTDVVQPFVHSFVEQFHCEPVYDLDDASFESLKSTTP